MITEALLYFITAIINGAAAHLPTASFPTWINDRIDGLAYYVQQWNFLFPADNFVLLLTFIFICEAAILTIWGVNAIVKVVRGSG